MMDMRERTAARLKAATEQMAKSVSEVEEITIEEPADESIEVDLLDTPTDEITEPTEQLDVSDTVSKFTGVDYQKEFLQQQEEVAKLRKALEAKDSDSAKVVAEKASELEALRAQLEDIQTKKDLEQALPSFDLSGVEFDMLAPEAVQEIVDKLLKPFVAHTTERILRAEKTAADAQAKINSMSSELVGQRQQTVAEQMRAFDQSILEAFPEFAVDTKTKAFVDFCAKRAPYSKNTYGEVLTDAYENTLDIEVVKDILGAFYKDLAPVKPKAPPKEVGASNNTASPIKAPKEKTPQDRANELKELNSKFRKRLISRAEYNSSLKKLGV